jgi:hypothetical protein
LAGAVLHGEQGAEQVGVEVLHFVDEKAEGGAPLSHDVAERFDQFLEVEVGVAADGPPSAEGGSQLTRSGARGVDSRAHHGRGVVMPRRPESNVPEDAAAIYRDVAADQRGPTPMFVWNDSIRRSTS